MCFATVIKKKREDFWIVVQGVELTRCFTTGNVVYEGKGGEHIVAEVCKCFDVIHSTPVVESYSGYDPRQMLGYKNHAALMRYTFELTFWEREDGSAEGLIDPNTRLYHETQPILKMDLFKTPSEMRDAGFMAQAWNRIERIIEEAGKRA